MPGSKPVSITLSDRIRGLLEHIVRRQTNPQRLVRRARIILMAAAGVQVDAVAADAHGVGKGFGCDRFAAQASSGQAGARSGT